MKQRGHIELERSVDSIRVGSRHRVDLGDIDALASSIEQQGLLQPITVTPDGVLVCGARRLAALRQLGVRKVNVWVRAGISDRLMQLLAEQDENALHKPLSPVEAAALYRECKELLAEEAARRQRATRFTAVGSTDTDGAVTLTAPFKRNEGDARTQAALLVTGRRSYTTLERVGRLQAIADDETVPMAVRDRARVELDGIEHGGPVLPAFRRVSGASGLPELDRLAGAVEQPTDIKDAAPEAAFGMRAGRGAAGGEDPNQLAMKALNQASSSREPSVDRARLAAELKRFVFTWDDLSQWWENYDAEVIALGLTDEQWQQFEATVEGSAGFAARVREHRQGASTAARRAS